MNPAEYSLSKDGKNVALHLKINALLGGLITPSVTLYQEEKIALAPSEESGYNNYYFSLGEANKLAFCMVNVQLLFDLSAINQKQLQQYYKELSVECLFSGGKKKQAFSLLSTDIKVKSEKGTRVMIIKDIMLNF